MLRHRVRSGVLMGAALLAALYLLPPRGTVVLLMAFCGLGLWEFYSLLAAGRLPHNRFIGLAGGIALIGVTWWGHQDIAPVFIREDGEAVVLFAIAAAVFLRQLIKPNLERAIMTMGATLLGIVYVAWLFNFLNKLLLEFGFVEGRWLILYLVMVVKSTDIGAFFTGCRFGGRKFCPAISPAKTWSGVVGGMLSGVVMSLLALQFMGPVFAHLSFSWIDAVILGLLLAATGIAGDLVESLFKRSTGVKDSGTMIQGMGGFLDVVDSLLLGAPVLYIYMRLFVDIVP